MAFKQRHKDLKEVVSQLRSAVNAHGKQADIIEKHIDSMEDEAIALYVSTNVSRQIKKWTYVQWRAGYSKR